MTRIAILAGLASVLAAGTALAQAPPPPAPGGLRAGPEAAAPPPPPGGPRAGREAGAPPPPGGPGPDRLPPPPPPPPSKAAHFRIERGDAAIDVKCADDEPMRACADIALQLADKLATLPVGAPR